MTSHPWHTGVERPDKTTWIQNYQASRMLNGVLAFFTRDIGQSESRPSKPSITTLGLIRNRDTIVYAAYDGFYCRYKGIQQVKSLYGNNWMSLTVNAPEPKDLKNIGYCGDQQGFRRYGGTYYYVFQKGWACKFSNQQDVRNKTQNNFNPTRLPSQNLKARGVKGMTAPCN